MTSSLPAGLPRSNCKSKKDLTESLIPPSKLQMASSRKDNMSNTNISTGVKTKLHKWIVKASKRVRDKRIAQEMTTEIVDSNPINGDVTNSLLTQHSRSRSAPIPMPHKEKTFKKTTRKWSVNFPPTVTTLREDIVRENERNHSYSKNGIPQVFISPSVQLDDSSIAPSGVKDEQTQNDQKETFLEEQAWSVSEETSELKDAAPIDGINGFIMNQEVLESNARAKRKEFTRKSSSTSIDLSEQDETTQNGRMVSAVSLDSIPRNVQELSGQIQSRLKL